MAKRGVFITLEGGEGTGKSTQIKLLSERLAGRSIDFIITREPGGTPGAEAIRDLIVTGEVNRWSAETELLLFTAARRDHLERVILPALADGKVIVCDRYIDSTVAYQGVAGGVGVEQVMALSNLVLPAGWLPDVTLILDLPIEMGLERAAGRGGAETRFEEKGVAFHQALSQSFRDIAAENSDRCHLINAAQSIEQVAEDIWAELASHPDIA